MWIIQKDTFAIAASGPKQQKFTIKNFKREHNERTSSYRPTLLALSPQWNSHENDTSLSLPMTLPDLQRHSLGQKETTGWNALKPFTTSARPSLCRNIPLKGYNRIIDWNYRATKPTNGSKRKESSLNPRLHILKSRTGCQNELVKHWWIWLGPQSLRKTLSTIFGQKFFWQWLTLRIIDQPNLFPIISPHKKLKMRKSLVYCIFAY